MHNSKYLLINNLIYYNKRKKIVINYGKCIIEQVNQNFTIKKEQKHKEPVSCKVRCLVSEEKKSFLLLR